MLDFHFKYLCILMLSIYSLHLKAQPTLEVDGAIKVGNHTGNSVEPGTIRWNGTDLEGFNGIKWISLTNNVLGTLEDKAGNVYKTLKIGDDRWMIENLRTNRFTDETTMGNIISSSGWAVASFAAVFKYNNSNSEFETYGYLYNGFAANDSRLCPEDWHVSTVEDWNNLIALFDPLSSAGGALKELGTINWSTPNSGATNVSGLSV